MNRPGGGVPQTLRGIQTGFGGQQQGQPQQSGRAAVSTRLPNAKLGNNGAGWAFGGGMPLGGGGLPNASRQLGGNLSFAQSLSGSQPATPLDLSEFPSLSNNAQMNNSNPASMWSSGSRHLGGPVQRTQGPPLATPSSQQDDIFGISSRMSSAQGSFRFGNQSGNSQTAQGQSSATDEFPPLNRNANGDIGQERGAIIMSSIGFGSQPASSTSAIQTSRAGNGLLNALSANARATETQSPTAGPRPQDTRSPVVDDEARQKVGLFREDSLASQSSIPDSALSHMDNRKVIGTIGNDVPGGKGKDEEKPHPSEIQDPLNGMAPIDRWGLKGLRTLLNNYADYNALTVGIDPANLGLDLNSTEPIATQIYSLFDDTPPRPAIPNYHLPDCYQVKNVQPIETKISSFNEETLMWIFYSCPGDVKQQMAASELNSRNWRWHKKHQLWLTKDELMVPQMLSDRHERGYYVIWDTTHWRKERRELTLLYTDLDNSVSQPPIPGP